MKDDILRKPYPTTFGNPVINKYLIYTTATKGQKTNIEKVMFINSQFFLA